jgi:hypothetical protein
MVSRWRDAGTAANWAASMVFIVPERQPVIAWWATFDSLKVAAANRVPPGSIR